MKEIETREQLEELATRDHEICDIAFQGVDFAGLEEQFESKSFRDCIFLGCNFSEKLRNCFMGANNAIFPRLNVPFKTYPSELYTKETLYNDFDRHNPESYNLTADKIIYDHYMASGKNASKNIYETLARRLHDHGITDALMDILNEVDSKRVVAIMGGHGMPRDGKDYATICHIAWSLSKKGFFLLSGGGPGAMEATHLGAWFNGYGREELDHAIEILSKAPLYSHQDWLARAFEVMELFPRKKDSVLDVGIPTWLYGHEPPTPFASKIAKYFANSVREEGLLALAKGGVIYTPGSAGTVQEVFQDFTQNYYNTYGIISPMIFFNSKYWTEEKPVYPLLKELSLDENCDSLISISDSQDEIIATLMEFAS